MTGNSRKVRKAVIAAAGESLRLRPLTDGLPKCFLQVGNRRLVDHAIETLTRFGVDQIAFVVGYRRDYFAQHLGNGFTYLYNPFYATTNNMASLWFAKDFVRGSDFIYMHGDLLFHPDILAMTLDSEADIALAVEETSCDEEMMKVRVDGLDFLESSKEVPLGEAFGEWTGIAKFTSEGWERYLPEIEHLLAEGKFGVYDTEAMNRLALKERAIRVVPFSGLPFIEIDYAEDLERASKQILPQLDPGAGS